MAAMKSQKETKNARQSAAACPPDECFHPLSAINHPAPPNRDQSHHLSFRKISSGRNLGSPSGAQRCAPNKICSLRQEFPTQPSDSAPPLPSCPFVQLRSTRFPSPARMQPAKSYDLRLETTPRHPAFNQNSKMPLWLSVAVNRA